MKQSFPRADAIAVAKEMVSHLEHSCEKDRLIVAGSLRRGKQEVGDVEIIYVPLFEDGDRVDMFAPPPKLNMAESSIQFMLDCGMLVHRPAADKSRDAGWGPKNKLAIHVRSGIPVDLFCTTEENWWTSLVIRTGPKDFNLKLTTGAQRQGLTLNAYGCGVTDRAGHITRATSEQHVCELCGVPYAEPASRR